MFQVTPRLKLMRLFFDNRPRAFANIQGNADYPDVSGFAFFYEAPGGGMLIEAEVFGLPDLGRMDTPVFYAFHLHENGDCSGRFEKTGGHYNPGNVMHPYHAGDFPPLMSNNRYAWLAFYDAALSLHDVIGKSIVIHENADDFKTQPSGGAGEKIGCGVIRSTEDIRNA